MSGLFGSLSMAARALDAQRFGLDVAGQNIANVNTPGYSRRSALFAAIPPYEKLSAGGGVEITGLRAMRDDRLERRLQQERPAEQREQAIAQTLAIVETALGKPGQSLDASLNAVAFYAGAGYSPTKEAMHELEPNIYIPCVTMNKALHAETGA